MLTYDSLGYTPLLSALKCGAPKATIKKFKSKLISRSNISLVNTSCIHRENKKTKESDTLIITYLTHPDYNNSPSDFQFYKN